MAGDQNHWDSVYDARGEIELTWFEETPEVSLKLIETFAPPTADIIDVGGGASRLVDTLLARAMGKIAVLDLSKNALRTSQDRLGSLGENVDWIQADITKWAPQAEFDVWHDRAVFHFLTDASQRAAYANALVASLKRGGIAIIASFAEDGPVKCSGLPIVRYAPKALSLEIDRLCPGIFVSIHSEKYVHVTPKGNTQSFQYSVFRKL
jgi:SAM-dependent methyltransferase